MIERGEDEITSTMVISPGSLPRKASVAGGRRKSAARKSSPPDPSPLAVIGLLTFATLSNYVPKLHGTPEFDKSHLRLGMTPIGLLMVMERIGFIYWARDDDPEWKYSLNAATHGKYVKASSMELYSGGWKYVETYDRGRFPKIKWVDKEIGKIKKHKDLGLTNVTGYDIEV